MQLGKLSKICPATSSCPHNFRTCLHPRYMSRTCPGHFQLSNCLGCLNHTIAPCLASCHSMSKIQNQSPIYLLIDHFRHLEVYSHYYILKDQKLKSIFFNFYGILFTPALMQEGPFADSTMICLPHCSQLPILSMFQTGQKFWQQSLIHSGAGKIGEST